MKVNINKQKIMDTVIDMVVISAVLTFLWNLILPATIGMSAISYWVGLGIVAHIYGIWHLFRLASEEKVEDGKPVAKMIPIRLLNTEKTA